MLLFILFIRSLFLSKLSLLLWYLLFFIYYESLTMTVWRSVKFPHAMSHLESPCQSYYNFIPNSTPDQVILSSIHASTQCIKPCWADPGGRAYLGFVNNLNSIMVKRCFTASLGLESCVIMGRFNVNTLIYQKIRNVFALDDRDHTY